MAVCCCLPYVVNPFVDPITEPTTGKKFDESFAHVANLFGQSSAGLMQPNNQMALAAVDRGLPIEGGEVVGGVTAAVDRMRRMLEIRDKVLPQLESGITGTHHGQKSAVLATVLTGLLMLAPFGIDLYQLIALAKEDGIKEAAGTQLAVQVVTEGALIVAGVLWGFHRWALARKAELAGIKQADYDNARSIQNWVIAAHNLNAAVKPPNSMDDANQIVAFRQSYNAWINLPAANKQEINIDLYVEQHLNNLPAGNTLKASFNRMRTLAYELYQMRVEFLQHHPQAVVAGHPDIEVILGALTLANVNNPARIQVWRETHKNLASEWLHLQAKIGPLKEFDILDPAPAGWRCKWPGAVYHMNEEQQVALEGNVQQLNENPNLDGHGEFEVELHDLNAAIVPLGGTN